MHRKIQQNVLLQSDYVLWHVSVMSQVAFGLDNKQNIVCITQGYSVITFLS